MAAMTRFPKFTSIQSRLASIFLAFVCLLIISVLVTFLSLETQKQDARVINLAGRQRMLLQQMTSQAHSYRYDRVEAYAFKLQESVASFEQTLTVFQKGGTISDYTGKTIGLEPPKDQNLIFELNALQTNWSSYRGNIDRLLDPENIPAADFIVQDIESQSAAIIVQADHVVLALEEVSSQNIKRLSTFQIVFLAAGLLLLSAGWWVTRHSVVLPLKRLGRSAQQIGSGDLDTPIPALGPQEVKTLGSAMDAMRAQVLQSNLNLTQWAATVESRVQHRTRELEALASVSREISLHLSIGEVLNSVAEKAQELSGAEVASLCLLDAQGKILSLHATSGPEAAFRHAQSPAIGAEIGNILHQTQAQVCGLQNCHGFCQIIAPGYRTSHLAVPLRSQDKVIGALCIGSAQPNAFRSETAAVLTQLAGIAAVAFENSRAYQQAEHAATLEERQRMASEMHDGLLQTLSFLGIMVRWAKEQVQQGDHEKSLTTLHQIERAEAQAEIEIRRVIASLQDDFPLNYTLQEQLTVLADEVSQTTPPVCFETELVIPVVLPASESEQVLRVAREALLNAQRYSQADMIRLVLKKQQNELSLIVQDLGVGFDPQVEPSDDRAHFGMKIMHARAARMGGVLLIQSTRGQGTQVTLRWTPASAATLIKRIDP